MFSGEVQNCGMDALFNIFLHFGVNHLGVRDVLMTRNKEIHSISAFVLRE